MPWFVVQSERKTWTKYIVEAKDEEAAIQNSDGWQYVGYVDGEDTESTVLGGPFNGKVEARADLTSYVDSN